MSSGRDEMLSRWTQEEKQQYIPVKTPLDRMRDYKATLLAELERLEYHIKELESDKE